MLVKNTGLYYTIRLGGAWINCEENISIWPTHRVIIKHDNTYKRETYKSFRICKLQRKK